MMEPDYVVDKMQQRGISTSYPFLSLAQTYDVPYDVVLRYASPKNHEDWIQAASLIHKMEYDKAIQMAADVKLAKQHFELVQKGRISWR